MHTLMQHHSQSLCFRSIFEVCYDYTCIFICTSIVRDDMADARSMTNALSNKQTVHKSRIATATLTLS
jgi:hypothetical protein